MQKTNKVKRIEVLKSTNKGKCIKVLKLTNNVKCINCSPRYPKNIMYQFFNYSTKEENVSEHKGNHVTQCIRFLKVTVKLNVSNLFLVSQNGKCIISYLVNRNLKCIKSS